MKFRVNDLRMLECVAEKLKIIKNLFEEQEHTFYIHVSHI